MCHGSRVPQAKMESFALIDRVKKGVTVPIQETCFLELQDPTLSEVVRKVVDKGVTKIIVMPILLLTAGHAKKDIPEMIGEEKSKYPDVTFIYGRAIEVERKMVDVLVERIKECTATVEHYDILLVGRGSSDMNAIADTEQIVTMLRQHYPANTIEKCFLAASKPKFEEFLTAKIKQKKSVLILPYILFTGLLDVGIKDFINQLRLVDGQEILLADYLGHHRYVSDILIDRVREAKEGAGIHAAMVKRSS